MLRRTLRARLRRAYRHIRGASLAERRNRLKRRLKFYFARCTKKLATLSNGLPKSARDLESYPAQLPSRSVHLAHLFRGLASPSALIASLFR